MKTKYEILKEELVNILDIVKSYPDNLQGIVLDALIRELLGSKTTEPNNRDKDSGIPKRDNEIPGIAYLTASGEFRISIRDLKAKNQADSVKRLVYIIIHSYMKLKEDELGVSRKKILNPTLENWRVYDGNCRRFLSGDVGIKRENDTYSLDTHAESEAKKFMDDILDKDVIGSWTPSSARKRRNEKKEAEESSNLESN